MNVCTPAVSGDTELMSSIPSWARPPLQEVGVLPPMLRYLYRAGCVNNRITGGRVSPRMVSLTQQL
jgi:hypothetical protein